MIDIEKLEALAKAAGGESWSTECGPDGTFDGMHVWGPDGDSVCRVFGNIGNWPEPIDESQIAAHIEANSPKAILELCAEIRRLRSLVDAIPQTPEAAIAFIGSHYNAMHAKEWSYEPIPQPTGDLSMVKYSLTVHDLLSAFSWAGLSPEDIEAAKAKP